MFSRNKLLVGILALAIIAGFALSVFAQGQKSDKLPLAFIDKKTVNLGDVIEAQDVEYAFVITNKGGAELQIVSVRPG